MCLFSVPWSDLCGPGWIYDKSTDFCYYVVTDIDNFFGAEETCKKKYGELASIGSKHEQMFVKGECGTPSGNFISISIKQEQKESEITFSPSLYSLHVHAVTITLNNLLSLALLYVLKTLIHRSTRNHK